MSFFELPPPEPPRPSPLRSPWHGPPEGVIGRTLALNLVLGRSENAAVSIDAATVYPEGFVCRVAVVHRLDETRFESPFHSRHLFARRGSGDRELPPELLRVGIEFADGRKATSLDWPRRRPDRATEEPAGPVLRPFGGGGGAGRWRDDFYVWPLPSGDRLTFVCEWPAAGIGLMRAETDAAPIRAAAAAAIRVWDDGDGEAAAPSEGVATQVRRTRSPEPPRDESPAGPE